MITVSVDVGRSSCKTAYFGKDKRRKSFFTYTDFATDYNLLAKSDMMAAYRGDRDGLEIISSPYLSNGNPLSKLYLFGDFANKIGEPSFFRADESSVFHNVSVALILYSVAKVVQITGDKTVSLAINLTYSNYSYSAYYKDCLKGLHKIQLLDDRKTPVSFTVDRLYCLFQGYSALFSFAKMPEVSNGSGVCIDIGKKTTDLSFVTDLSVTDSKTIDLGIMQVFDAVKTVCVKNRVNLSDRDLEAIVRNIDKRGVIVMPDGSKIDVKSAFESVVQSMYSRLKVVLDGFFGSKPIDYILFVGGGSIIFNKFSEGMKGYKVKVLSVEDPVMANAYGMLDMIGS